MTQKAVLSGRLDLELIERIRAIGSKKRVATNEVIACALEALDREEKLPATVAEQVDQLGQTVRSLETDLLRLIDLLEPMLGRLEESVWRVQKSNRLILQYLDLASIAQNWPEYRQWTEHRESKLSKYENERNGGS